MIKEVTAIRAGRPGERDLSNGLSLFWLSILLLALLGVIVAASSKAPVIWMLVWPAPLILIFTAARFIREGFHKRDGLLVLGRRVPSPPLDLSVGPDDDIEQDDANSRVEVPITTGYPSSVVVPSERFELAGAVHLAMRREASKGRRRLEKRFLEQKRSLAQT
ncbi:MAG: hypothetical protein JO025_18830 [Verrucomicrobia bacterium]|nr:hypothetical protein [Verrucomicrobiota bacterium]